MEEISVMEKKGFNFIDLGRIDYASALLEQHRYFDKLLKEKVERKSVCSGVLLFCEHPPVITFGRSAKESNLLVSECLLKEKGIESFHVDRGGDVTYHGPGQITGYPIFDIEYWNIGLKEYIYRIEEVVIRFLSSYGVKGERLDGATGVWIEPSGRSARKICAIGVRSSRYVTMHGFALNINTDLTYFSLINPCGFTDKGVTSLAKELGCVVDLEKAKLQLSGLFAEVFP